MRLEARPSPKFEPGDRIVLYHGPGENCPDPHPDVNPQATFRVANRAWWETNEIGQATGMMGWMYKLIDERTKTQMTGWGDGWVNENRMRRAPKGSWSQEAI